jgi:periplasmic divalent cation tolerance protein
MTDVVVVLTTMPDDETKTDEFARRLIDERLVACVSVHASMKSTYRWNNRVECERERQIVMKTTRGRVDQLQRRLQTLHPYEVPEFLVLGADTGSDAYVKWVNEETTPAR